ncbi:MAG: hypothetical protein Q9195_001819 [Heterodermia aff. obscurata]
MLTEPPSEIPKPPVKRALFNKPAWSRPQNLASPVDFFHRANSATLDPVEEAERKRKDRAVRKQAENARQKAEEQPAEKRRRISGDDDDDLYGVSDQEVKPSFSSKPKSALERPDTDEGSCTSKKSSMKREPSPKSLSKRFEDEIIVKEIEKKSLPQPSNIIDLEESDEDEDFEVTEVKKPPPPEEDDFPASDEEYAELARKAREKARRKRLQDDILAETQKRSNSRERDSVSQQPFSTHASATPPPPLDPEVFILVTSRLENAVPLIIKRRLSQRLKDVRLTWCFHNKFSEEMMGSIFLTWRGKRLFDVTSCKSLGIAVDKEGRVMAKDQEDILADEERKIHMEAMTEDIYEEYQKAKRRATEQEDEDKEEEPAPPQQKPPEVQIRLILKAKDFPDFKLIAKPATTIAKMIAGFRKANPAETLNKDVYIVFDGDRLDPEIEVAQTELSDMDEVDVYSRHSCPIRNLPPPTTNFLALKSPPFTDPKKKSSEMKILTTSFLTCAVKACKTSPLSFPLHYKDAELEQSDIAYNPRFLINILPRLDWDAVRVTAAELGFTVPDEKPEVAAASTDTVEQAEEKKLRELHTLLLETEVREGKLVCGNCGHEYKIKEGIANFLLPSYLGNLEGGAALP